MLLSGPHFVHHTMAVTLRNTKRNKKWTDSGTNFSARKMKGHCSPECDQQNEIGKKGESIWPRLPHVCVFLFSYPPKIFLQTSRDTAPSELIKPRVFPRNTYFLVSVPLFIPMPSSQNLLRPRSNSNAAAFTRKPT